MHRSRITQGLDMVPSQHTAWHRAQRTEQEKYNRDRSFWLLVLVTCVVLSLAFGSCKPAQVARVKQPKGPLLGLRDVEQPEPKHGWHYSDAAPSH